MFIAALFTIAKTWKQPKCNIYICKMGCYSAIRRNEILPFAAMWMDLENIMLIVKCQTEKSEYCMISLICGI